MSRELTLRFAASRFAFVFAIGVALLPGVLAALAGLSYLQHQHFPIVDEFEIASSRLDDNGDVIISGSFHKIYRDWVCEYRNMQWFMPGKDPSGNVVRLRVASSYEDVRENKSQNNRQAGHNYFHGWKINISEYPDLNTYTGFTTHRCLWVIPARTYLPVFRAPVRTVE